MRASGSSAPAPKLRVPDPRARRTPAWSSANSLATRRMASVSRTPVETEPRSMHAEVQEHRVAVGLAGASATVLRGSRARPARSRVASTLERTRELFTGERAGRVGKPQRVERSCPRPRPPACRQLRMRGTRPPRCRKRRSLRAARPRAPSISAAAATSSPARRASARQRAPASSTSTRPRPPATANASKTSASRPSGERRAVKRVSCTPSEPSDPARRPPSQASCHP